MGERQGPLEDLVSAEHTSAKAWAGRRVFITGHTGFKGGWLSCLLSAQGARLFGYALPAPTNPSLYEVANISALYEREHLSDLRHLEALRVAARAADPEVIFHLAAQPLVRASYSAPIETLEVNVLGTAHLLEVARELPSLKAVIIITTDKCYENRDWEWGYRETDALGGHDLYSSSKACAELVTSAYARSFLTSRGVRVATARAGNVIGGGDWAQDRLVPDLLRGLLSGGVTLRSPGAVRPWQHVLEPLSGYLLLAEALLRGEIAEAVSAWNFGPRDEDAIPVSALTDHLRAALNAAGAEAPAPRIEEGGVHEARFLKLDSSKARAHLGWEPRWRVREALSATVEWHMAWASGARGEALRELCASQATRLAASGVSR